MLRATSLLCLRGGRPIFAGLSLHARVGELLRIHGANGSGKTSLLRILAGLMPSDEGRIEWEATARPSFVYLAHRNGLKAELSVRENLVFSQRFSQRPGCMRVDHARIDAALARLGLDDLAPCPLGRLSQGQQRRAALARVLAADARVWLLDEPTTALDPDSTALFEAACAAHLRDGGAIIYANHHALRIAGFETVEVRLQAPVMEEAAAWWMPLPA